MSKILDFFSSSLKRVSSFFSGIFDNISYGFYKVFYSSEHYYYANMLKAIEKGDQKYLSQVSNHHLQKIVQKDAWVNKLIQGFSKNSWVNSLKCLFGFANVRKYVENNKAPISYAAKIGDLQSFDCILNVGEVSNKIQANVHPAVYDEVKINGTTEIVKNHVLREAVCSGSVEMVSRVLGLETVKNNLLENLQNGKSALGYACEIGNIEIIRCFLKIQEVQQNIGLANNSVLLSAVKGGHLLAIDFLLKNVPKIRENIAEDHDQILVEVVKSGNVSILDRFLELKEVQDNHMAANDNQLLYIAAKNHQWLMVKRLLEFNQVRENAAVNNNYVLREAARCGELSIVDDLLKIKLVKDNVAIKNNQPIINAVENHNWAIVKRFLKFNSVAENIAVRNNYIMKEVIRNGNLSIMDELLKIKAIKEQISSENLYMLKTAMLYCELPVVKRLCGFSEINNNIYKIGAKGLVDVFKKDQSLFKINSLNFVEDFIMSIKDPLQLKVLYADVRQNLVYTRNVADKEYLEILSKILLKSPVVRRYARRNQGLISKLFTGLVDINFLYNFVSMREKALNSAESIFAPKRVILFSNFLGSGNGVRISTKDLAQGNAHSQLLRQRDGGSLRGSTTNVRPRVVINSRSSSCNSKSHFN